MFNDGYCQIDNVMAEPSNLEKRISFNKLVVSPETAAFHRVNFLPVNLYTGKPSIDIPLYVIKTGDIEIPISLKYDIGANKVDEVATNTGWGWSLQAGGSVTRMVRDIEDHDYEKVFEVTACDGTRYCDDFGLQIGDGKLLKTGYLRRANDESGWSDAASISNLSEDALPDLFLAQAPGLSSQFHLERNFTPYNTSQFYDAIVLDGSSTRVSRVSRKPFNVETIKNFAGFSYQDAVPYIEYNYIFSSNNGVNETNPLYQIRGIDGSPKPGLMRDKSIDYEDFNLVNNKGVNYLFSTYDINESLPSFDGTNTPYWRLDCSVLFPNLRHVATTYRIQKNTWHLNKIRDNKNKEVNFSYKPVFTFNYEKSPVYVGSTNADVAEVNKIYNSLESGEYSNSMAATISNFERPDYNNLYKTTQQQILDKITWDQGEVLFFYDLSRKDRLDSKALTEIKVKNQAGNIIKHYKLNYSYFQSSDSDCPTGTQNEKCYRLKLDKIDDMVVGQQISSYSLSYNQTVNIPKVNALSKDFLGYYNGKPNQMFQQPGFTFSPNKNRLSVVPFQSDALNTNEFIKVNGAADISPTNQSLNGLLTKITYPTGGKTEFEYENNMFNFYGKDVLSPGARIKNQKLDDGKGNLIVKKYEYQTSDGKSSGTILNFPKIIDLMSWNSAKKELRFQASNYVRSNIELTQGAYVGYSRIIEKIEGNGLTEYIFNGPNEYPNEYEQTSGASFFSKHSFYPGRAYVDHDNRRGTLSHKYVYSNNGIKLNEENFKYDAYKELNTKVRTYTVGVSVKDGNGSYKPGKESQSIKIISSINRPSSKEVIEYLDGKPLTTKTEYAYASNIPSNLAEEKTTFPSGEVIKKNISYLNDLPDIAGPFAQVMNAKNMVSIPMGGKTFKNDIKVSEERVVYAPANAMAEEPTTPYLPKKYYKSFGPENIVITEDKHKVSSVDQYDSTGNTTQYTTADGNTIGTIWGYNNTLPIAKIEGKDTAYLMGMLGTDITSLKNASNNDISKDAENVFLEKLNTFQKRQDYMDVSITTYTHDPLIGVTNITPPSGNRMSYIYNTANQLEKVLDVNTQLVKEYKYNYIPTQYFNVTKSQKFYKSGCGTSAISSFIDYTVAAGTYSSLISQADADQQAQNEINSKGQIVADTQGSCTSISCNISQGNAGPLKNNFINVNNSTDYKVRLGFKYNSSLSWNTGVIVGKINGTCVPSSDRSSSAYANGIWMLTIDTNGNIIAKITSASPSLVQGIDLDFNFTYSIY